MKNTTKTGGFDPNPKIPNKCRHSFEAMAQKEIPALLQRLQVAKKYPLSFKDFSGSKSASVKAHAKDGIDFPGCYIFFEANGDARYIGISRNLLGRIWTHYNGKNHQQTSLVYKVAGLRGEGLISDFRKLYKESKEYRDEFAGGQAIVRQWQIAFVQVDDDLTLYLLEVAASIKYQTGYLNCFRTH